MPYTCTCNTDVLLKFYTSLSGLAGSTILTELVLETCLSTWDVVSLDINRESGTYSKAKQNQKRVV